MAVNPLGPIIFLADAKGKPHTTLEVTPESQLSITLFDPQGFEMDLGNTQTTALRTDQTQQTSAASIIMFGNDMKRHVIWRVP
jgi:hypothetical protein